jgi:hypothetical protein
LCDVIAARQDGGAEYLEELPVDYVRERDWDGAKHYFMITLEYGEGHDQVDPFDVTVGRVSQSDADHSHEARYLHPIVRHYSAGMLVAEHHVTENLENEWTSPVHREPLQRFFAHAFAKARMRKWRTERQSPYARTFTTRSRL